MSINASINMPYSLMFVLFVRQFLGMGHRVSFLWCQKYSNAQRLGHRMQLEYAKHGNGLKAMTVPSGKHTKNYRKSPCSMGKSTISMVMFNSYVKLQEGIYHNTTMYYFLVMNITYLEPKFFSASHTPTGTILGVSCHKSLSHTVALRIVFTLNISYNHS